MARTTRTFVAIAVPGDRASKLGRLQSLIAPELPGARWVAPSHFHATLAFLGDVPDLDLDPVCRAVVGAGAEFEPFELRLESLGVFPNPNRPRAAWVGIGGPGLETLGALQVAIVGALREVGYPPDDDRFHPHVTIGRMKPRRGDSGDLSPLLRHYQGWLAGTWPVSEVIVYSSSLDPEGPTYTPLVRAPLRSEKRPAST